MFTNPVQNINASGPNAISVIHTQTVLKGYVCLGMLRRGAVFYRRIFIFCAEGCGIYKVDNFHKQNTKLFRYINILRYILVCARF